MFYNFEGAKMIILQIGVCLDFKPFARCCFCFLIFFTVLGRVIKCFISVGSAEAG